MSSTNKLKRKLVDLRHEYGEAAASYFSTIPYCETCGEERLACLTIHHVHGKQYDVFKTLCFNCHMAHHSDRGDATAASELRRIDERAARSNDLDSLIESLCRQGKSSREIAKVAGVSNATVSIRANKIGLRFRQGARGLLS